MAYASVIDLRPRAPGPGIVSLTVLVRQVAHAARLVGPDRVCRALRAGLCVLETGDPEALEGAAPRISRDYDS